jgi:hypothetical protein
MVVRYERKKPVQKSNMHRSRHIIIGLISS